MGELYARDRDNLLFAGVDAECELASEVRTTGSEETGAETERDADAEISARAVWLNLYFENQAARTRLLHIHKLRFPCPLPVEHGTYIQIYLTRRTSS